jgi:hypothetical protein
MERKTTSAKNTALEWTFRNLLRAWFSPEEYKQLYTATRQRVKEPEKKDFNWDQTSCGPRRTRKARKPSRKLRLHWGSPGRTTL